MSERELTEEEISALIANMEVKSMTIHAVVTRADGRIEDHGMISAQHKNPLVHLYLNIKVKLQRFKTWLRYLRTQEKQ